MTRWSARAAVVGLAALAGCEVVLDPIGDAGRYFSMSGYLDTEADTNWVRVELVAETFEPPPGLLDVQVRLEGPGRTTPLTQETVEFVTGTAHLFWTTEDLEPGVTYTLVAERSDGAKTRASVQMPDPFPEPTLLDGPYTCPTTVTVRDVERVADAFSIYHLDGPPPRAFQFDKRRRLGMSSGGTQAYVYFGTDALEMGLDPVHIYNPNLTSEIVVAVVTSDWPEEIDLETDLIPRDNPNIENGIGFVGGVTSWRSTFQPGLASGPFSPPQPCLDARQQ